MGILDPPAQNEYPSYASGSLGPFDGRFGVFNWRQENTHKLHLATALARSGGVGEIIAFGDSLMALSTLANGTPQILHGTRWLDYALSASGLPVGGTGLVRTVQASTGVNASSIDTRWTFTGAWTNQATNAFLSAAGTGTFTTDLAGDTVDVWYYDFGSGSPFSFTISVNGASSGAGFATVTQTSTTGWKKKTLSVAIAAGQTVKMTWASGLMDLLGAQVRNAAAGGMLIHNVAQPGSTCQGTTAKTCWGFVTSTLPSLYTEYVQTAATSGLIAVSGSPHVFLVGLGANDLQGSTYTPAQTATAIQNFVSPLQTYGDVVLVLSQQLNDTLVAAARWESYAGLLYGVAKALNVPLIDLRSRYGNYASTVALGVTTDGQGHFVATGNAGLGGVIGRLLA